MTKKIKDPHKITATQNEDGKFVLDTSIDLIPKEVVEELMNMTADATVKKLAESSAKELADVLLADPINKQLCTDVLIWRILAWISLAVAAGLALKLKGVI
jgi:hypothetical protein